MDGQTEIKKVITVDLGSTSTSLKEYKKHIEDLRGALLQLDETSEDYDKVAKEIAKEQDKLNEVMKVGKQQTDAAEGSYNQLTQTMAELKKQWKATADEAERAELGEQILSINNKLKDLDASTGNFQRNVGDYANAFEQAFDKCLDGISSIDGPLGEIGGSVKNMLPVIKSINSTATAGLSGIKKGIASTGIGLLVIAVGELIAHWRDLAKIVGISEDDIKEFKESAINVFKNIVAGAVGVGNAVGNFLLAPIRTTIEAFKGLGNIIKDVFTGNFDKVKEDANAAWEAIKGIGTKAVDFRGNYEQGKQVADNMIQGIEARLKSPETSQVMADVGTEIGKTVGKSISKAVDEETEETIDSKTQSILDRLHKRYTDELTLLEEKYNEEKTMLEQYGLDTTQLEQEYAENRLAIVEKMLDAETKAKNEELAAEQKRHEQELKNIAEEKKNKEIALNASLQTASSVFGALKDLSEENSKEYKAFAIMETTISTLEGAINAYKSMAGIPYVGPALGIAAAAAVTAAGLANIQKIRSTNKESSGGASVAAPQTSTPSMTQVNPLLDEQADLNRITTLSEQGNSTKEQQNIRVYVVDQDIRDANNKAEVVEDNATF